jgi:hypothetical protein
MALRPERRANLLHLPCDSYSVHTKCQCVSNVRVQIGDTIPCLHTSIMAKDLSAGEKLHLRLSPGKIVALKSAKFDLTLPRDNDWVSVSPRMDLDMWNINNDIVLRITILRGTNKVFLMIAQIRVFWMAGDKKNV